MTFIPYFQGKSLKNLYKMRFLEDNVISRFEESWVFNFLRQLYGKHYFPRD
jgi:hypothetical protein